MSNEKANSRPIDEIRNSAMSMRVGAPDDGKIMEMVGVSDRMLIVMERAIHVMQLADSIDPARTNIAIPNTQQKLLSRGANDPIVAKTLLTAQVLFKKIHLGNDFDEQRGLALAFDLLKDITTMADMLNATQDAQDTAIRAFENETAAGRHLTLPAIGDAEARCHAFAQKVGHTVDILRDMARLFYGEELKTKWINSLSKLTEERYGSEDPFTKFVEAVCPFLLFLREMRNMIEHPKADWHIEVFDFRLLPSGQVMVPSMETIRPGEKALQGTLTSFMSQVTDDIANVAELLMAYLCNSSVLSVPAFPIQVVELPLEQRSNPLVRMSYGCIQGDQTIRVG